MDTQSVARGLREAGVGSIQFLAAGAMGLIFFLLLANLVVVQYGRGAIRSALDQGVRSGSVGGSQMKCEERIAHVLGELLSGTIGDEVEVSCDVRGSQVVADARVVIPSWTPLVPDYVVTLTATAVLEGQS